MKNIPFKEEQIRFFAKKAIQTDTKFIVSDFTDTFELVTTQSSVYLDPPFSQLSPTANFTGYAGNKFAQKDHEKLLYLARKVAAQGVCVLLSDHDTPITRSRFKGSKISRLKLNRSISAKGSSRGSVTEILVTILPEPNTHEYA